MTNDFKKILKVGMLSGLFIFIFIYGIFKAKYLLFGSSIKNLNIIDGQKITEEIIQIKGNAKNAIYLAINDREISVDKDGNFEEYYATQDGYNVIKINSNDKFGNKNEEKIHFISEFIN